MTELVEPVVLVSELLARKDHRDADGGQQTNKRKLDAFLKIKVMQAGTTQHVEQSLAAEAFDVVRRHVVDRLGTIAEAQAATVDGIAHRRLEVGLAGP